MAVSLRDANLRKLAEQEFDVLIIGGGINGAVSAASLAARGVRVALIDRGDFASGVSSSSSNLAWGGIKYLETGELLLVNKLCKSRNRLMRAYPSTVREIRFLVAIQRGFRFWPGLVYLGSVLYWIMGRFATRAPRYRSAASIEAAEPIVDTANAAGGLEYSDCYLYDNDARFVFNFVRSALNFGCVAANYVESIGGSFHGDRWEIEARDRAGGRGLRIRAAALINACGPWVDPQNALLDTDTGHRHLLSKGIHLIVDRLSPSSRVLTFFASDGRMFFLIPMGPKTCIGTTDTRVTDPVEGVTEADRDFVLDNVNALLDLDPPLSRDDIIAERVGVRPLAVAAARGESAADPDTEWVQLSRKHVIEKDTKCRQLSIYGGKLTDCLNVGDEVAGLIGRMGIEVPDPDQHWYGEPADEVREQFMLQARRMGLDKLTDPSSPEPLSERFWRRYGNSAFILLERIREDESCAALLIEDAEYTRCEIELAARREMIVKLEDFMRRRSKIELVVRAEKLRDAPGLREACRILFGDQADAKLMEYLEGEPG